VTLRDLGHQLVQVKQILIMIDIRDYIKLSTSAQSVAEIFTVPEGFKVYYENTTGNEKKSLIRHFIVNNVPFTFKDKPMLYEQLTQYIADKLEITPAEIKLIGSAKTGFSFDPSKYGKTFGPHSDLDFVIVNENLFNKVKSEFNRWSELFASHQIKAFNDNEQGYWKELAIRVPSQLNWGFIDSHSIPNRNLFPTTQTINNSLYLVKKHLGDRHSIIVKKTSARIYRNWHSFGERLSRNIKSIMSTVSK
jgi:hypothetical protein